MNFFIFININKVYFNIIINNKKKKLILINILYLLKLSLNLIF